MENGHQQTTPTMVKHHKYIDKCPKCGIDCTWIETHSPLREEPYRVPFCHICDEEIDQQNKERKKAQIERYKEEIQLQSNLPTRYDSFWFDTYPTNTEERQKMVRNIEWYTNNWKKKGLNRSWLTLWGGVGTGKTCMSVIVAKCLISYYAVKTRFISGQQLVDEMVRGISDFKLNAKQVQDYYYNLPLLIIDDFWAENGSAAVKNRLFDLLNSRYHKQNCTILTTNVLLSDSNDPLLVRLWDRIKEQPNKQIKFDWNSLRESE